jgi:FMN phosphatase YigB (HAD superfamily)
MPAKLGATGASSVTGAIIFDLGNVLIDFNHMIAAQRLSQFSDKSGRQIYDLFFDSELTGLFEEGKVTPGEFFLEVKKALNLKTDYAGFLPVWNEIFFLTPRNLEVYQLALLLKKHYKLALLSNINILHLDYLKKNFPVFDAFHCILASFELGLRKPAPLVYGVCLSRD